MGVGGGDEEQLGGAGSAQGGKGTRGAPWGERGAGFASPIRDVGSFGADAHVALGFVGHGGDTGVASSRILTFVAVLNARSTKSFIQRYTLRTRLHALTRRLIIIIP